MVVIIEFRIRILLFMSNIKLVSFSTAALRAAVSRPFIFAIIGRVQASDSNSNINFTDRGRYITRPLIFFKF